MILVYDLQIKSNARSIFRVNGICA